MRPWTTRLLAMDEVHSGLAYRRVGKLNFRTPAAECYIGQRYWLLCLDGNSERENAIGALVAIIVSMRPQIVALVTTESLGNATWPLKGVTYDVRPCRSVGAVTHLEAREPLSCFAELSSRPRKRHAHKHAAQPPAMAASFRAAAPVSIITLYPPASEMRSTRRTMRTSP